MKFRVLCPESHPVDIDASRVGGTAICPRCLTSFLVEMDASPTMHARKEERKRGRARDDDDDDEEEEDEEERPRKKAKARKADDEEEDERPRKKAKARDDDDEDEEDDEDDEPQVAIKLTKLQRRLKMVHIGMTFMQIAVIGALIMVVGGTALGVFLGVLGFAHDDLVVQIFSVLLTIARFSINALALGALIMGFWAPPKAEAKGTIIAAIVFGVLMLFFTIFKYLGKWDLIMADELRNRNFADLFNYFANICDFGFFLCTMIYLKCITSYLRDMMLASEPITIFIQVTLWYVVPQILSAILFASIDYHKIELFTLMILVAFSVFLLVSFIFCLFLLFKMIFVVIKIRDLIAKAIEDAA